MDIFSKLKNLMVVSLDIVKDNIDINPHTEFKHLGINSVNYIKFIVAIEDEFSFEFEDEELVFGKFQTVQKLIEYISVKSAN